MSVDALIFWLFVAAWLVVAILVVFALVRVGREAVRIFKRVKALVDESPLPLQISKAEADVARLNRAIDRLPILARRADEAAEIIRTTPLVPPALIEMALRVRAEYAAFRAALR